MNPSGMTAAEISLFKILRPPVRLLHSSETAEMVTHVPAKLADVHTVISAAALVSSSAVGAAKAMARTVVRALRTKRAENIVQQRLFL